MFTHGGRNKTNLNAIEWCIELEKRGAGEILLTSMDRDGTKTGFDIELLRSVSSSINIPLIASGGAGALEHLSEAIIEGKSDAVLAAVYFIFVNFQLKNENNTFKLRELQ